MKLSITALAMAVGFGAIFAAGAAAQTAPAGSISELLNRVRSDAREATAENQRRLSEFRAERNTQTARLGQVRGELSALQNRADQLEAQFAANQEQIDVAAEELRVAQGAFGELFGSARQTAGEFSALIGASMTSAQHGGRTAALDTLANSRTLPTRTELDDIWQAAIEEMVYQAEIATFSTNVVDLESDGPVRVTRVGPFIAFAADGGQATFVEWVVPENSNGRYRLVELEAQPPANLRSAAMGLYNAEYGEIATGPVDPTRGGLLRIYRDVPDLGQRIDQGRIVGKIILGLLAVSSLFGIYRLLMLVMTSSAVAAQKRRSTPGRSNPLGRVMLAYEGVKDHSEEVIEMKLDEAILKETPKLEFGLNFLKLAAGIAPLLGLLGTVTGMIKTFTQITLFGTGDPKIMAGGISEALVTTVLGLVAAIPLLFIHSFAQSFARGVQQTLEEQAAGIVARHAEERAGGGS